MRGWHTDTNDLQARYRDILAAASDLLDAVDRSGASMPTRRSADALAALRAAVTGQPPPKLVTPRRDPRRHLLSMRKWEPGPDDRDHPRTYPLAEIAADLRHSVEGGRANESYLHQPRYQGGLAISGARALVFAELMTELAYRMRPGTAVGPIDTDESFSQLALDLVEHLSLNTPFGAA
jgi:hypothetical protein